MNGPYGVRLVFPKLEQSCCRRGGSEIEKVEPDQSVIPLICHLTNSNQYTNTMPKGLERGPLVMLLFIMQPFILLPFNMLPFILLPYNMLPSNILLFNMLSSNILLFIMLPTNILPFNMLPFCTCAF